MNTLRVILPVFLIVIIFISPLAHADGLNPDGFSKFHEISPLGDDYADAAPVCCALSNGILVVWISNVYESTAGSDLQYAFLKDDGTIERGNITFTSDGSERDIQLISAESGAYLVWATDSPSCTHGQDWDIVVSYFDGTSWKDPVEVSPHDDDRDDFYPHACFISSTLYISWISTDGGSGTVMMATYNTATSTVEDVREITGDWKGSVMSSVMAPWYGNIMFACVTNDTTYTHGIDYDIVTFLYTSAGITQLTELSSPDDSSDDIHPFILYHDGSIYLAWQTSDKTITDGDDDDIVVAVFDGSWSPPEEITEKGDEGDDSYPLLYIYESNVYIMWNSADPSLTSGTDWDIVTGPLSGPYVEITPIKDGGYDDGDYYTWGYDAVEYNGGIFFVLETENPDISSGKDRDIVYLTYDLAMTSSTSSDGNEENHASDEKTEGTEEQGSTETTSSSDDGSSKAIPGPSPLLWIIALAISIMAMYGQRKWIT